VRDPRAGPALSQNDMNYGRLIVLFDIALW